MYFATVGAGGKIENSKATLFIENDEPHYASDLHVKLAADSTLVKSFKWLTMREARDRLIRAELFDDVEAMMQQLPEGMNKKLLLNWWEFSTEIQRDQTQTQAMATQLWPDAAERERMLDQLFAV